MRPSNTQIAVCIAFVIVIIFTYEFAQASAYRQILNGYWEAPTRFCASAGLRTAQIYLNGNKMYVYMDAADGAPITNGVFSVDIRSKLAGPGSTTHEWNVKIHSDSAIPLPDEFVARFDPAGGMLGFYSGDTIYLELYKDSKATSGVQ